MNTNDTLLPVEARIEHSNEPRKQKHFIEANTIESTLEEMRMEHIIPVFVKDNETLISYVEFIESVQSITYNLFRGETILHPAVRLSHQIKAESQKQRTNKPKTSIPGRRPSITNVWHLS